MRIGIYVSAGSKASLDARISRFEQHERSGFATAWLGQLFDCDALTVLALAGSKTRRIELGSWVIPTYPRHPAALAQQALTTQAATGGRLVLGIGPSHHAIVADRLGLDDSHPLGHTREYLEVLRPLLRGETATHSGNEFRTAIRLEVSGSAPPPVLLAALGPKMLDLAAREADGVAIWLGGMRYLEDFALPRLRHAASSEFRIACGLPVLVSHDEAAGREAAEAYVGPSARLPAYRRVLAREGATRAGDVAIVGDEREVERSLERLRGLGVTDFNAIVVPSPIDPTAGDRTGSLLAALSFD